MPWSLLLLHNLEWFILRCNNFFVCFFFFFSHYHWWNRVFNICINSILHWIMSQKYWGLYRWMILLHNLNERPVSGRLNLIIYFLNKVDFLTWWSNQHHSYWHCYSQMPKNIIQQNLCVVQTLLGNRLLNYPHNVEDCQFKGQVKEVIKQRKPSLIGTRYWTFLHLQSSLGNIEQLSYVTLSHSFCITDEIQAIWTKCSIVV